MIEYQDLDKLEAPPGALVLIRGVQTSGATSMEIVLENVKANIALNLPMLEDMTEYGKPKGDKRIAIVGGGPSLRNTYILKDLREVYYKTIIACGSVHDYLIENGIIPTYATNCDPSPISAGYFTKPDSETKYLMASNTDKKTMEALKGHQIIMWHCHSEEVQKQIFEWGYNKYNAVGGGCTVGLRSLSIAICLGYSNIHFFGFDSCMDQDGKNHHAYDWASPEEANLIEKTYKIQLGPPEGPETDKCYYVAGYQLAQLEHFKDFYLAHKQHFTPTFHGDGALADYLELIKRVRPTPVTSTGASKEQENELRQ